MTNFNKKMVLISVLIFGVFSHQIARSQNADDIVIVNRKTKENIKSFYSSDNLKNYLIAREFDFNNGFLWFQDEMLDESDNGYITLIDNSRYANIKNGTIKIGGKSFLGMRPNNFDQLSEKEKQEMLDIKLAEIDDEISQASKSMMTDVFLNGFNIEYNFSDCKSDVIQDTEWTQIEETSVDKIYYVCNNFEKKVTNSKGQSVLSLSSDNNTKSNNQIVLSFYGVNYDNQQSDKLINIAGKSIIKFEVHTSLKQEIEEKLFEKRLLKEEFGYSSDLSIKGGAFVP